MKFKKAPIPDLTAVIIEEMAEIMKISGVSRGLKGELRGTLKRVASRNKAAGQALTLKKAEESGGQPVRCGGKLAELRGQLEALHVQIEQLRAKVMMLRDLRNYDVRDSPPRGAIPREKRGRKKRGLFPPLSYQKSRGKRKRRLGDY